MGRVGWAIGVGIISEGMPLAFLSYYRVYPQSPLLTVQTTLYSISGVWRLQARTFSDFTEQGSMCVCCSDTLLEGAGDLGSWLGYN